MKLLEKAEAQSSLAEYVDQITDDFFVIAIHGKPVAALLSLEHLDVETLALSLNPKFQAIIERSRLRDATEGRVSSAAVKRMFAENGTPET